MRRRMIIGVTGSMQSGKQEVGPVWSALGWHWLDLNDLVDDVHRRDRDSFYTELGLAPLGLKPNGRETFFYHQKIYRLPEVHRAAQDHEEAYVLERLLEMLPGINSDRIVLNWGYVYKLLGHGIPFDHVMVFHTQQRVWLDRIHRANRERLGWEGDPLPDDGIIDMAQTIEMDADVIRRRVAEQMGQNWSLIDSSGDDWGEANLRQELVRLGW